VQLSTCRHVGRNTRFDKQNWQENVGDPNASYGRLANQTSSLTVKSYLPHLSITQADDTLYCETCTGIPIDRWQRKHPSQRSKTLRPSLALIRPVIQSAFGVDVVQAGAAPCQLYFNPKCEGFEWNQEHRLRCGHEIWNALG
jgi:hypothetical protein